MVALDRVSLYSHGCLGTHYVDLADLEFSLPLLPSAVITAVCHTLHAIPVFPLGFVS